nr:MAG TPA: hypothetical protein [Caudoviricetes sp.]
MYNIFTFKYTDLVSKIKDFSIIDYQYDSSTIIRLNKLNNNIIISNQFSDKAFNISILDAKIKKLYYGSSGADLLFRHMYKLYIISKIYDQ